ncbi:hypothetical protein MLD38_038384 [Melastoma candidum]|uniref:Uncharacterized protein n=1 Tax=Melastoma candidum TaxID=119954 RepID=A0ACB9KZX6_9MYRT|nr:hypothetical protein MLD38_038384 [Melastoma candidum]
MALSAADLPVIYGMLTNSMSGDVSVRKPAEDALAQFESRQGFCSCLMEVITAKDLTAQVDVRLMAAVYFKNSVNRYWRNRRDSLAISNEEKVYLKQKLLAHLREENYQIAAMLTVLISKIARFDYPKEWPELFTILAQQLQSADTLTSHRVFMIIFRTLKELSSKRLASDQRNFMKISSQFFDFSWHLWQSDIQTILQGFSSLAQSHHTNGSEQHNDELHLTCERWLLCLKIIRQLVVSGYPNDAKSMQEVQPVKEVSPLLLTAIQSFWPYYSSFQEGHPRYWDFIKRACVKLMKVLITIQGRHPYSFGNESVLQPIMEFCLNCIVDPSPDMMSFEDFLIQCMIMVKSLLECKEYKPSLSGRVVDESGISVDQMKKNVSTAVGSLIASLLPHDRIILLCNVLIRRYFVLTATDLEDWYANPESFHHEQDMIQWSEKLRPCAEALYIVLFENNSQLLGPVVVSILQEAMSNCPSFVTEITPGLLLKDAAYGAAAYVYYELSNYLSFKDWFNGALSLELSNDGPNMRIIHRKVALILGHWVSEVKDDIKRPVYCTLIKLLQDKDLAVRLAACRSIYLHVEDTNFLENEFSDLLTVCFDLCFKLVEDVQEFDSKVQILNLLSVLIGHVRDIMPFTYKLLGFFQKIWEESAGESLLQIQLLIALRNYVIALGYQSPLCYNMLLPILQRGIDVNSPDELNLLEDGMLLWEATISHAPSMTPPILSYFPCLVEILEKSFDHLQVAVSILEGYIILGGSELLSVHASNVAKLLDLIVGNVNDRGLLSTLPVIEFLIQCFPVEVPPLIGSTLQKLIVICLGGGDDRDPSKTSVKAASSVILARILVMNTCCLAQLTSEPSLLMNYQNMGLLVEDNLLLYLVDTWLDKVDNVGFSQKKTLGLALSVILTLRMPQVLDKLDQILSVCTSVIMAGSDDSGGDNSSSDNSSSSRCQDDLLQSREQRRRQLKLSDPLNQLSLESSVRDNLQTCASIHGESFNSAISRMHPSALSQLKQALKMQ